jgi:S1-C subfamily serine protease
MDDGPTRRRLLGSLGSLAVAGIAGCNAPVGEDTSGGETAGTEAAPAASTGSGPYTRVYRETSGSVVLVRVYTDDRGPSGQGSGFVWDGSHVVTNHHVVAGSDTVRLQFAEGEWREATVVGSDGYADLAVVEIEDRPDYATPLPLVDDEPPVGTQVVALGAPYSLDGSVSAGIISGQDRSVPSGTGFRIADGVQTDAAVNPGNSGGPLVTLDGEVVGVINSGGGDNVAFAISAALSERIVPALITSGEYDHPYMGVTLRGLTPLVAQGNDLARTDGVLVVDVLDDGPSEGVLEPSAGTATVEGMDVPVGGDVILEMGDRRIPNLSALSRHLALETRPGDTIPIRLLRDGEERTVDLTLGERPAPDR